MKRLIFKVNNLEKKYGSISALDLKKLDIHPGTIYGIVGNVGSGKSTLLNILAGAERESSGTVLYEMAGVSEEVAREAFKLAAAKLPVRTTFIKKAL